MASYTSMVTADVERWRADGLISADQAAALLADIAKRPSGGVRLGGVLAILASTLIGASLLLIVAANWEAFPRLARVGFIFVVLAGGYVGGALAARRGSSGLAEALWLLGGVAFGGGIALIGQMYHLSGDEAGAILVWSGGTALAAIALRSYVLTSLAVLLAAGWMVYMTLDGPGLDGPPAIYLLMAAGFWLIATWTRSVVARHLVLLSLILFALLTYVDSGSLFDRDIGDITALLALTVISASVFVAAVLAGEATQRLTGLREGLAVQGLLGFLAGLAPIQIELAERPEIVIIAAIVFAGVIAALMFGGRENRMLRWLAYLGFVVELAFVYVVLIGSMLGTAGFFLMAGIMVALLAWGIARIERRMAGAGRA